MNNSICKKGIYNTFQNDYLIGFNIKDIWKNTINIYDCINIKKKILMIFKNAKNEIKCKYISSEIISISKLYDFCF